MNSVIRGIKAIYCLVKALLGLPYVPTGILVLLVLTAFGQPPDLILTAMLLFAFPVSWLCRLQCEREQRFYKKLYMDSKSCRQTKSSIQVSSGIVKSCPVCNKIISKENNFCPYCATDLREQKLQQSNPTEAGMTICPRCNNKVAYDANFCAYCGEDLRLNTHNSNQ
jgi:RNA polymerase subunit RPABC4/transcription elongation factor Spt4